MTAKTRVTGGCQCGAIRYVLLGKPKMLYICHCSDCQKQSSSAFGMSLIMPPGKVGFIQGKSRLKTWQTRGEDGTVKRCAFCPDCGTRIMHGSDSVDDPVSIKADSLDGTRWLNPVAHIWLKSAQSWVTIDRDHHRGSSRSPVIEPSWNARGRHKTRINSPMNKSIDVISFDPASALGISAHLVQGFEQVKQLLASQGIIRD